MKIELTLSPADIAFIERYLPYVAGSLDMATIKQSNVLRMSLEEVKDLQNAIGDVLMAYGFDEEYDVNSTGRQAENLLDAIQEALRQ